MISESSIDKCREIGIRMEIMGSCLFVLQAMYSKDYALLERFDDSDTDQSAMILYKEMERVGLLLRDHEGYLNFVITPKGIDFIRNLETGQVHKPKEVFTDWIKDWIGLWKDSKGHSLKSPDGRNLACSERDATVRMNKFLNSYAYLFENLPTGLTTKELVIKATEKYLSEYKKNNYAFCKNAYNFIMKQEGSTKDTNNSILASECENFISSFKNNKTNNTSGIFGNSIN